MCIGSLHQLLLPLGARLHWLPVGPVHQHPPRPRGLLRSLGSRRTIGHAWLEQPIIAYCLYLAGCKLPMPFVKIAQPADPLLEYPNAVLIALHANLFTPRHQL